MYAGVPITMPVCVRCPSSRVADQLGDAEVEQLRVRVAVLRLQDPDVVGLEIAVDDALPVRRLERLADLAQQAPRLVGLDRAALHPIGQALAVEELHHEVVAPVGQPPEREDVDDVGVADLVDGAGLVDERAPAPDWRRCAEPGP